MTKTKYDEMTLDQLRQYTLKHREDIEALALHKYIDRSKSEGQMSSLDLSNSQWEEKVKEAIDLDLKKHNIFVWSPNSAEVFIFSLENGKSN